MRLIAETALLPEGWTQNVAITVAGGLITAIDQVAPGTPADTACLLPGMANLHSHAFQRGFAGLTETRGDGPDSFWTWRDMMYRFALHLDPEGAQAIAEMAYVEMLEAGFTRVGEFHYLHHDRDGRPYADPAEMAARICAAAQTTGLHLTLLPVFYAHGGFGAALAQQGQRRFLHDIDSFVRLIEICDGLADRPGDRVGIAPHSLRAVSVADLSTLVRALPGRRVHLHIAEQMAEVDACLAFCGRRPVDWLFDHAEVTPDWCLIHATHLSPGEIDLIARSGAVVGLCPVTEANLGDGAFPAAPFLDAGGRFGLGTDSNVRIGLAGEMRCLEYGQRLTRRARNVLAHAPGSTGQQIFERALSGGAQALDAPTPQIAVGAAADLVGLTDRAGLGTGGPTTLDRWVFGADVAVADVWVQGRHLVRAGRHLLRDTVAARFATTVGGLLAR